MMLSVRWWLVPLLVACCLPAVAAQPVAEECSARSPAARGRSMPGQQERYRLTFRTDAQYDFSVLLKAPTPGRGQRAGAPTSFAQDVQVRLAAGVETTVIDRVGSVQRVMVRLVDATVQIDAAGQKDDALARTLGDELRSPVFADVAADGRIVGLSVPPGSHGMTQGLWRTVLAQTQFTHPADGNLSKPWESEEDDPNGAFPVRYVPLGTASRGGMARYRKTRDAQTTVQDSQFNSHSVTLAQEFRPTGSFEFAYDGAHGRVLNVAGVESIGIWMNHKQVGRSRSELRLVHTASNCVAAAERARWVASDTVAATWNAARHPLSASLQSAADDERMIARTTLGEDTLETLLAGLRRLSARDGNDETGLYLRFKALMNLHPESCAPIAERLLTLGPNHRAYRLVVGAFSAVGHAHAQAALLRLLMPTAGDAAARTALLVALATVDRPTPETLAQFERDAAQTESPQVAATAQLGQGVFARKLWSTDRLRSDALAQTFVSRLDASTDVNERLQWLAVLGNGGTPIELEPVLRHLAEPNPVLRSMAVSALRWQADPRVGALLIATLRDDADENVRASAARTLELRSVDRATFVAFKTALARDPSVRVRHGVLVMLWQLRADHPEVVALVSKAADSDPDPHLRTAARALLKR